MMWSIKNEWPKEKEDEKRDEINFSRNDVKLKSETVLFFSFSKKTSPTTFFFDFVFFLFEYYPKIYVYTRIHY